MLIRTGQSVVLTDRAGRDFGLVHVDRLDGTTVAGRLEPGKDFAQVKDTFQEWLSSVNDQLFADVDRLDAEIAAMGLRVRAADGSERMVTDLQPGDGSVTLQVESDVSANCAPSSCTTDNPART